jgi:hypothetical protein
VPLHADDRNGGIGKDAADVRAGLKFFEVHSPRTLAVAAGMAGCAFVIGRRLTSDINRLAGGGQSPL